MTSDDATFEKKVEQVLVKHIPGCSKLISIDRLSGGASQETYRIEVGVNGDDRLIAMRRSPGGEYVEALPSHPGQIGRAHV